MSSFPQGTLPRLIQVALAEVGTAETGNNKKNKQWHDTPKIGDFVFFDFIIDDKTTINHVGLVIRASEKQIVTIEGNTSGGGDQRNGGEVMVKSRALGARSFVVGYGRPQYEPFSGDLPDRPKGGK